MFSIQVSGDNVSFQTDVPTLDKIKRKVVLICRVRNDKGSPEITDKTIA